MASDKGAKPAEAPAPAAEAPKKNSMAKMAIMAAVVLVLEGATVGVTMVMSSGPKKALAEAPTSAPAAAVEHDVEVKVVTDRLPNNISRLCNYDLQVVAKVDEKNKDKVTELFKDQDAEIRDHIRKIVAGSDPKTLLEPGLETLRRQISYQLDQDIGKDLIKEVLIPKCTPQPSPY